MTCSCIVVGDVVGAGVQEIRSPLKNNIKRLAWCLFRMQWGSLLTGSCTVCSLHEMRRYFDCAATKLQHF